MHTVCTTRSFEVAARQAGMTDEETAAIVTFLAENPQAGDELSGTGGCRKVRIAGRGKDQEWWLQNNYVLFRESNARLPDHCLLERREVNSDGQRGGGIKG